MHPSGEKPVCLRNISTGHVSVDSIHLSATESMPCNTSTCMGSLMATHSTKESGSPRSKEEILKHAKQFLDQYYRSIKRFKSRVHEERWSEVLVETEGRGTYELRETELFYGAKLAWRNAPRCIGRIQWSKLQVFDARYVTTAEEMFEALCNHIKYGTNKGNIRSAITIFPQRKDSQHDFRIWNKQLIQYAGYRKPYNSIVGDPANVDFTELCQKLGWTGKGGKWDVLPLVLSANGRDPKFFEIPEELILRVPLSHPSYEWFEELELQWYALPAVSSMLFDVGGLEFPAAPFNGWYMVTEIAARNLCDPHRYNILEDVISRMNLDPSSSFWKDRALLEVHVAVLHSFQKANVTIVDHHTACTSFMKHWENEHRLRGGCPGDWIWLVPPLSGSLTPVFHQEMLHFNLKPSYEHQEPSWKSHIWEKDGGTNGTSERFTLRKLRFKEVAKAVKFTSNLFGRALSRRAKSTILFATETGKSETYAKTLRRIFSQAFNVSVICMDDYDIIQLQHETLLLVVTSTFGNGYSPENGQTFARGLQAIKVTGDVTPDLGCIRTTSLPFIKTNNRMTNLEDTSASQSKNPAGEDIGPLSNIRFSVFALGSSAYPNFCSFGYFLDNLLGELGGERILKIGTGDELCGQEQSFWRWAQKVFQTACDIFCVGDEIRINDVKTAVHLDSSWSAEGVRLKELHNVEMSTDICKGIIKISTKKVFPCILKSRQRLHPVSDRRETVLIKINTRNQDGLTFLPGDHIGIYPANREELVEGILDRIRPVCPDPDKIVQLEVLKVVPSLEGPRECWLPHKRLLPCSVRTAFFRYFDITTPPTQTFLGLLNSFATSETDCKTLQLLTSDTTKYEEWKDYCYPTLLEVLQLFPSVVPSLEFLMTQLPFLQPRFYSISSSPNYYPGEIHITAAVIKYRTQCGTGSWHYGVCSTYLAALSKGEEIVCFIRSAPYFHLPDDIRLPIVMVGPGTGIAPFRSFWQQRLFDVQKMAPDDRKNTGEMTLFFGCRHRDFELFREEKEEVLKEHVLTTVYTVFSRLPQKPKRYVQDKLREVGSTIFKKIMQERCHFYVCGDVSMAEEVSQTLKTIIQDFGVLSPQQAETLMMNLREENRYHEDIFGITLRTAEVTDRVRHEARTKKTT
ncbi:nitric oxide synthase [Tachypleus tridentatus]|uniref:nitric oxide synthase n=1 Tax=Tachypleus tridentatus TaxID=6853 RepID=UPI003FD3028B